MNEVLVAVESQPEIPRMAHDRVLELVGKWRGLLLLNGHHVDVQFTPSACNGDDEDCAAEMRCNTPYQSGHLMVIHPRFFDIGDDAERERKIVHELCHIITGEAKSLLRAVLVQEKFVTTREARAVDERLTDFVANVVYALVAE